MKTYIKIALFILATNLALSQNNINPKVINGFNFSSTFIDKDYFQNNFIRGWNWGWSDAKTKVLDKALHINSYHSYTF